ncbi:CRISPR-associated endonuclease Cas2 [Nitrosomonas sp. HPC101]|uniref:CRISPR-associated endonuclease Cas2 n=1 Tax=Nitrosomonas sp. HPC101 TaxID=1658667 RepID=UPI00136FBAC0|nr:CRISPR-associated endonuclease Cas2 [Nitrosomonas sp. HPC101]MXS85647.1 CRISPR-associated endonuclease Cas2 [Nitrosomonas sp. HPC101]
MSDFVICYDISNPRRLGRLYRYLLKRAMPLQYSVFLFSGDDRQLECFMQDAIALIDEKQDDLRVYPLPGRGLKARIGRPALPEGIQWSGMPAEW